MAPSDSLKEHAASSEDFYDLLSISPSAGPEEIRRAYRRTALKYHPDKIANPQPADLEKFHLLQIAYDLLSDPEARELYNNAREARERRKREHEMLEGVRKKMKEDLEARERVSLNRSFEKADAVFRDNDAEEKLQQRVRQLAEDGARRTRERQEFMRREILEEEERKDRAKLEKENQEKKERRSRRDAGGTSVPSIDRTIKVNWRKDQTNATLDKAWLESLFSRFGQVEGASVLKDKKQRMDSGEKKILGRGIVVYASIVAAHKAVEDFKRDTSQDFGAIDSVGWAAGQAPNYDFIRTSPHVREATTSETTETEEVHVESNTSSFPKKRKNLHDFPGLGKATNGASSTPADPPTLSSFAPSRGPNSPSLEEITMIRLKNAERKG